MATTTNQSLNKIALQSSSVSLPWKHIVQGHFESDLFHKEQGSSDCLESKASGSSVFSGSDVDISVEKHSDTFECGDSKKPVWNKPSKEPGLVMGSISWPALSEAAKASGKTSSHSWKSPEYGSSFVVSQETEVVPSFPSPKKQVVDNVNPNHMPNNAYSPRHRSTKRGGTSVGNNYTTPGGRMETPHGNLSPRDHALKADNWESGQRRTQSHNNSNHLQQRNSFKRGNVGPQLHGDGSYHNNFVGRWERDPDRSGINNSNNWNPQRNSNGMDGYMYPHGVVPRSFVRPQMHTNAYITPQNVEPFGNPMGFGLASPPPVMFISPEPFRGVPFFPPISPQPMIFPGVDPQLHALIVTQIEYYFSNENLIKDTYLRQNMDSQGWVDIKLISGFNQVKKLTNNIPMILSLLHTSNQVEVQGNMVRRRNDWLKWVIPTNQISAAWESQASRSSGHDMLASRVERVTLEETSNIRNSCGHADTRSSARAVSDSSTISEI